MRVRIARDELRRGHELTQAINALEAEIAQLVADVASQVLTESKTTRKPSAASNATSPAASGTSSKPPRPVHDIPPINL